MNVIFCDLASLVLQVSNQQENIQPRFKRLKNHQSTIIGSAALHSHVKHVGEYVVLLLNGETIQSGSITRPLSVQAYNALLPSIWSLLNSTGQKLSDDVFDATVNHAIRISSTSSVKRLTVEFLSRLALVSLTSLSYVARLTFSPPAGYRSNLPWYF